MPAIPPKPASLRVKIWRRLQAAGAICLRGAVYVLPNREECAELFEWIGRELREQGGQRSVCEARFLEDAADRDLEARFAEARNADYAEVAAAARALLGKLSARRVSHARRSAIAEQHGRLMRRFGEITAIDFLGAPGRGAAEGTLAALDRALPRPEQGAARPALEVMARPRGATWVTRTGVHVDRIASAWLIRRFIDPEARFAFVPAKGYRPRPGELRFDMFEAELTHVGDRCTFEVLLARMGLGDPALAAIGEIVHDLDLRDDKFGRPEAAGVRGAIDGICAVARGDEQRIAAATPLLDGLYATFAQRSRRAERSR
jgi:hypothetical protein